MNTLYHDVLTWLAELPLHPDDALFGVHDPGHVSSPLSDVTFDPDQNPSWLIHRAFCVKHLRTNKLAIGTMLHEWRTRGGVMMVLDAGKKCDECEAEEEYQRMEGP